MTIAPHIAQVSYNNINQLLHFRITFVKKEFCGKNSYIDKLYCDKHHGCV